MFDISLSSSKSLITTTLPVCPSFIHSTHLPFISCMPGLLRHWVEKQASRYNKTRLYKRYPKCQGAYTMICGNTQSVEALNQYINAVHICHTFFCFSICYSSSSYINLFRRIQHHSTWFTSWLPYFLSSFLLLCAPGSSRLWLKCMSIHYLSRRFEFWDHISLSPLFPFQNWK